MQPAVRANNGTSLYPSTLLTSNKLLPCSLLLEPMTAHQSSHQHCSLPISSSHAACC